MENAEFKNSSLHFYLIGVRTLLIIGLLPLGQPPHQKVKEYIRVLLHTSQNAHLYILSHIHC